jgi:hypothetical protein
VSLLRRSASPIREMSMSSISTEPSVASTKRKKDNASVLLPEPANRNNAQNMSRLGETDVRTCASENADFLARFDIEVESV